jgi:TldD protein
MAEIERREFIKLAGTGLGVVVASGLFHDRLLAGALPADGAAYFADRFGASPELLRKTLEAALSKGGEFAEVYLEHSITNSVTMEEDIVRESSEEVALGAGVRVLSGQQTGYAYTSDLSPERMRAAALTAASIASSGGRVTCASLTEVKPDRQLYPLVRPLSGEGLEAKIGLVKAGYAAAQAFDKRVTKVQAYLVEDLQHVAVANSEGLLVSDIRPQVRLAVTATAEENGLRGTGRANNGGRVGMAFYETSGETPKSIGERAAKEAITLLSAVDPVAGEQTVILGKDQSGVMIHEAVGHPLEGDGNWQKTSIMWDKMGQMVASPLVTIYDDMTIPAYRGSMNVDDEGTPTRSVTLIDKGRLVGYLNDRLAANMLKMPANGHGRRQSFRDYPIPRMGNTVLAKGESDPEEILRSVKKGFYAHTYQGGQVEGTGKFVFSVNTGYLVEDGKLTRPVKNATLIGTNVQILKEIDMVGSDMGFFLGSCGKGGQWAAVTAGTPTLRIRQMTVGGRK